VYVKYRLQTQKNKKQQTKCKGRIVGGGGIVTLSN
jgi:hypothetical protein